jgi:outer membrane protein
MMKQILMASAALLPAWSAASAQDGEDLRVRVGLGAQLRPEYIGADKTEVAPLWDLDIARGAKEFEFEANDDHFGISLIGKDGFSAGPVLAIGQKRSNKDVGLPLGKVSTTLEAGAFVEAFVTPSVRLRGEVRKGLGGHTALIASLGADQVWRDGDKYVFSVGPRVLFSDGRYQRAYFGVTPAASLATGLPAYRPGGGVHAFAVESNLSYQFSPRWGMFGFARYERLAGDAGRSPIVRVLGSRNQMSGGVGLSYTFTVPR